MSMGVTFKNVMSRDLISGIEMSRDVNSWDVRSRNVKSGNIMGM